jgi:hydrogenase maturation protease
VAEGIEYAEVLILEGRPGAELLDLLSSGRPCILLDVVVSGSPPGAIHEIPLEDLSPEILPDLRVSSHGFGPGEAVALHGALGRPLPPGFFLGIEGASFEIGAGLSPAVEEALSSLDARVRRSLEVLRGHSPGDPGHPTRSTDSR